MGLRARKAADSGIGIVVVVKVVPVVVDVRRDLRVGAREVVEVVLEEKDGSLVVLLG